MKRSLRHSERGLSTRGLAVTITAASWVTGCAESPDAPLPVRTVTDSAGVEIVHLRPPGWTAVETALPGAGDPLVEIGTAMGDPDLELDRVSGVVVLTDGTLVVADDGTRDLRFFTPSGLPLRRAGGDGEGPGEFRDLDYLTRRGADTLLVHDRSLGRVSFLDTDGSFLSAVRMDGILPEVVGTTASGALVGWFALGDGPTTAGPYLTEMAVTVWNARDGSARRVTSAYGGEELRVEGGIGERLGRGFRPFGREADFAAAGSFIYVLDGRTPDRIRVHHEDGRLVRVIRVDVDAPPPSEADVEAWIAAWMAKYEGVPANLEAQWSRGFASVDPPDPAPVLRALEVDRAGNVCAERYPMTVLSPPSFWCFTPTGDFVRAFRLPAGLARPGHPHFDPDLWIEGDRVYGVWIDELGVETVRGYRIPPSP